MDDREAVSADLLDTLYRVAADPDTWEELVDALPAAELDQRGLAPDLRRSLEIAERVSGLRAQADPRPHAVLVLDRRLRVVSADAETAERLGGEFTGQALPLADEDSEQALSLAIERLGRTRSAAVLLRFQHVDRPLVAHLTPHPAGASLSLIRPSLTAAPDLLGLTPAEARLVDALGHASGLKAAADALGVSLNTARNQLASVFSKVGARSQAELARLVGDLATAAPLAPGPQLDDPWPKRSRLQLPDGRWLAYRIYGDALAARTVLTFHDGLGSSLLPVETDRIARRSGLRVVAAERPGFGASDPLPEYDLDVVAADMEALCDRLDVRDVVLVGLFSGTAPMLATAARLGARVSAAVILSGRAPGVSEDVGGNPLLKFRAALVRHPRIAQAALAMLGTRMSPRAAERMLRRAAQTAPGDRAYLDGHPEIAAFMSRYVTEALEGRGVGPAAELAIGRGEPAYHLASLTAPLAIHHGAEDRLAPLEDLQAYLGNRGYEATVYPGIGQLMAFRRWGEILAGL